MEHMQKQFTLDFTNCSTLAEIYAIIKKELKLPEWFGENLSAFWDALTGMVQTPAVLTVHKKVANELLLPDVDKLIAIARRAEKEGYLTVAVIE